MSANEASMGHSGVGNEVVSPFASKMSSARGWKRPLVSLLIERKASVFGG